MVEFNLLPWREWKKVYEKRRFKRLLFTSAAVLLSLCIVIHTVLIYYQHKITANIETLNLEQDSLENRGVPPLSISLSTEDLKVIHDYQSAIKNLIGRLGEWKKTEGCFTDISEQNNTVIFTGKTKGAAVLTTLLTKWNTDHLFSNLNLEQLTLQEKEGFIKFNFSAILINKPPINETAIT